MPHSMIVKGSVMTSGGVPSAGGGFQASSAASIDLRSAIDPAGQ